MPWGADCHPESAHLLGRLIHNAPQLVLPYVPPIEKALVTKLRVTVPATQLTAVAGLVTKGPTATGEWPVHTGFATFHHI